MNVIDSTSSLGEIVRDSPQAADLFERLGLDFCCGGATTLGEAVKQRGLDAATVLVMLRSLEENPPRGGGAHDVSPLTVGELADHIVAEHHKPLRGDLEKAGELLDTVLRVHGQSDPSIAPLHAKFAELRDELLEHMELEENRLFPVCREPGGGAGAIDDELFAELTGTHEDTGAALAQLRELGGDYDADSAHCGTHRLLLQALESIERDLHVHIHEENNVLFPRVRDQLAARA